MASRLMRVVALIIAAGLAGWTPAAAQTVFRSGNTFHVRACDAPARPGAARCFAHIVTDYRGVHLANIFARNAQAKLAPAGYGPVDLRSAYNITTNGSQSTIMAIVDAYGYTNAEADMAVYRSTYGLPACTTANGCFRKYNESGVLGNYPTQNTGWSQETALDLDMASAICPNCKIILIEANSDNLQDLATAVNLAARLGAHVISNSYGSNESGTQSYESAYNHPGVAITVSAGDSGYSAGPQFPATSPHVIAVGGTSLIRASNARGWTETAWSDTGSGCSKIYAKPTWQKDPLCTMRMTDDVSAIGDPNTGVAIYGPISSRQTGWQVFGGTSVSAPLVGAIYANNGGVVTYGSNPYALHAALNDVVSGNNGRCGGTYFCTAGTGYDGPTGLGTPNGVSSF